MSGGRAGGHRRSSFAFIDGMVTTFGELPGFTPSCFMAAANPPSVLDGAPRWEGASRQFRYEGSD